MNILAINPFKIANTNTNTENKKIANSYSSMPYFGLKLTAPLEQDTVSFGAAAHASKFLESRSGGVSRATAKKIHKIATDAQPEIEKFMRGIFEDLIVTAEKPHNLISYIKGRAKSASSIEEKSKVIDETTIRGVLENMTDLNAMKIVLTASGNQNDNRKNVHKVLKRLFDAVNRGFIILEEVEVKRPKAAEKLKGKNASRWDYEAPEKLDEFVTQAEKSMGKSVRYGEPDLTPANYSAIHFLFRLPGQKRVFELQFMGYNVAEYKDLDDIIYKILDNKNVSNKYEPLVRILKPLVMTKDDKDFVKYIKVKEKLEKLKFSEEEELKLIERIILEGDLVEKTDSKEYAEKANALLQIKDLEESDLRILAEKTELEANYQDKEYLKNFRIKVNSNKKFSEYRAAAFLYQRGKQVPTTNNSDEYFLPLNVDLSAEYDLNNLYKIYKQCNKD